MSTENSQLLDTPQKIPVQSGASFGRLLLAFTGPGMLVAVGYMDPGNWITSVVAGASYKYILLVAILLSSVIAMQLQQMSGKLGIVTQRDLSQMIAEKCSKPLRYFFFIITELALMATDLAEVIGAGIALHLLFGWSILFSIVLTITDVFLLLLLMKLGFRKIEAIVGTLILSILGIFLYMVWLAQPDLNLLLKGYLIQPALWQAPKAGQDSVLTLGLGIVGATVMPHNLFLHSSLSQTRKIDYSSRKHIKEAVRFMTWDSNIQLSIAFVVNSLLLILGAALFYGHANDISAFSEMYQALSNPAIAGPIASPLLSTLFAVALLASGQNSTITGTLCGEIVMKGFLHIKLPAWLLRLVTRLVALLPVLVVAFIFGDQEPVLDHLLIYSQIFLSIALPFAIFPLVYFTSKKELMGEFANHKINTVLAYGVALILTFLNLQLILSLF
ncbi:Nramp family divalent metal transporter [Streptococcus halichoeri]|uniref:Nramp family divalent metal transporter n=1 Tax=Streptococcus halichoeri TaxID=254785 RepID=UPI001C8D7517